MRTCKVCGTSDPKKFGLSTALKCVECLRQYKRDWRAGQINKKECERCRTIILAKGNQLYCETCAPISAAEVREKDKKLYTIRRRAKALKYSQVYYADLVEHTSPYLSHVLQRPWREGFSRGLKGKSSLIHNPYRKGFG